MLFLAPILNLIIAGIKALITIILIAVQDHLSLAHHVNHHIIILSLARHVNHHTIILSLVHRVNHHTIILSLAHHATDQNIITGDIRDVLHVTVQVPVLLPLHVLHHLRLLQALQAHHLLMKISAQHLFDNIRNLSKTRNVMVKNLSKDVK
jgi:hypothetical protein